MNIEKLVKKYAEIMESDAFVRYEKDFANKIISELSVCYERRLGEPDMVKIVESVINGCKNLTSKNNQPYFEVSTNAIFIHGYPKSGVKFYYYGQQTSVELGDIIFIASIIYNGRIYVEKFTISQFKKDTKSTRSISWDIGNRKQLYLLSRFPKFSGVEGSIVPKEKDFSLPNYSGCLGSYGLLYAPGDFAFVSGTRLDSYLSNRRKISGDDLFSIGERRDVININKWYPRWHKWVDMIDVCKYFCGPYCNVCFLSFPFNLFLGNCHFSMNVYDFVIKYLRLCIGEPTVAEIGKRNLQARNFLIELMSMLRAKAIKENLTDLRNFTEGFFKYHNDTNEEINTHRENIESEARGGGIGIIYTTINLGEGE
jgi:hypothetical protein